MRKICKYMATALAVIMLLACLDCRNAYAGHSRVTVDSSSYAEEINTAIWTNPESDVVVKDGKLCFTKESTKYSRLITKSMVQQDLDSDELVSVSMALHLKSMPKKGAFILGFGLGSIESFSGEANQVEVAFVNNGGLQVELRSYDESAKENKIAKGKGAGFSLGSKADIHVSVKNNQSITVKVNGRVVMSEKLPFLPEGSVGFFQTGACEVEIEDLGIFSYKYDRPENCDFEEKFDNDSYNANLLFSKAAASAYVPSSMSVEEYDGDYVMYYENSGAAQISTQYQYSNFELTFDVPYLLRKNIEDEMENVLFEKSLWFGISFGDEMMEMADNGYIYSPEMVYFDKDSIVKSFSQGYVPVAQSDKYPFFAEDETRGFSVKISVVDAHVSIGMKWLDEKNFTTIGEFDTVDGQTPLGYVHIWTCGPANFAIDNIAMKNLDLNPNLIEVDYKTSKFDVPADYEYQEEELIFRKTDKEQEFNWYLVIPGATVLGLLVVGVTALITVGKRRREETKP